MKTIQAIILILGVAGPVQAQNLELISLSPGEYLLTPTAGEGTKKPHPVVVEGASIFVGRMRLDQNSSGACCDALTSECIEFYQDGTFYQCGYLGFVKLCRTGFWTKSPSLFRMFL